MKPLSILSTFLALALVSTSVAESRVAAQLRERYAQWDSAYRAHDVKRLAGMMHPRFRLVTGSGKVISRADYVSSLWRSQPPKVYATALQRASAKGTRAYAWTKERSGKPDGIHVHEYRDTWRLVRGHWLLIESRTLAE